MISLFFLNGSGGSKINDALFLNSDEALNSRWFESYCDSLHIDSLAFELAFQRFSEIYDKRQIKNDSLITLIDFSKTSEKNRLFIFDFKNRELLISSLVSHGINSGSDKAETFSNIPQSHKSSLGFYVTLGTYYGKHGYSLRLDGLDPGLNDNARKRAIVIHGADYVNTDYISKYGRIGRSFGCPALPKESAQEIIDLIKEGSGLFIYHPSMAFKY